MPNPRAFSCIRVSGERALTTLNGQCTQDLLAVTATTAPLAAFLEPKGRIVAAARVLLMDDQSLVLVTHHSTAEALIKRLTPAITLARGRIEHCDTAVSLQHGPEPLAPGERVDRPDGIWIGEHGQVAWHLHTQVAADDQSAHSARLAAGFGWITAPLSGLLLPQQMHYQMLGGVSFTKGCYIGQEIVARLEHLGQTKQWAMKMQGPIDCTPGETMRLDSGLSVQIIESISTEVGTQSLVLAQANAVHPRLSQPPFSITRQVAGERPVKRILPVSN